MLTLGRLAALAASVEHATRQDERARQLAERVELTREIHDRVMQRLFGLTLALGSGHPLTAAERQTCHDQLQATLVRSALGARPADLLARTAAVDDADGADPAPSRAHSGDRPRGRRRSRCLRGSSRSLSPSSSRRFATARSTPARAASRSASRARGRCSSSRSPTTARPGHERGLGGGRRRARAAPVDARGAAGGRAGRVRRAAGRALARAHGRVGSAMSGLRRNQRVAAISRFAFSSSTTTTSSTGAFASCSSARPGSSAAPAPATANEALELAEQAAAARRPRRPLPRQASRAPS